MVCKRFQSEGMKLLDGEMDEKEKSLYESHLRECFECRREMDEIGMVIEMTENLRLRETDEEFWDSYWSGIYRKIERSTGFLFIAVGIAALLVYAVVKVVTSPEFLTFSGISVALVLMGVLVLFISVARERYYERKNDPYRKVKR